ncbi:MAG TPA: cation diffusion facilitator family transporter [Syntrophorhabdaceae bacterium]|nr:cation diffusion facilitator family transporter [Syntrophorhabdaceae bacterium]
MDIRRKASLFAIVSAVILTSSKFAIGLMSGSLAVISSGLDSLLDIFMSGMNYIAIQRAAVPPDREHQYGHAKAENIAATVQSLVIIGTGGMILYAAIDKFTHRESIAYSGYDFGVMVLSLLFSAVISTVLRKAGEKTDSSPLKADALHYASDLYSNSATIAAIVVAYYTGKTFFDLLFSVVIAVFIIFSALRILRQGVGGLMDSRIPPDVEDKLQSMISALPYPYAGYHKMRSRVAGSKKYTDFHLLVCRRENIGNAHDLAEKLETTMTKEINNLDIVIHIEPCQSDCDLTEENCTVARKNK